jgi:hypothetical protein
MHENCFNVLFSDFFYAGLPYTLITGSGSGSVIQNDMHGLKPGDTLAIRPAFMRKADLFRI